MGELRADWRLRLRRGSARGPICGAGVLVDQNTALTCAHVVRDPGAVMWVEFAENSDIEAVSARVPPGGWLPGGCLSGSGGGGARVGEGRVGEGRVGEGRVGAAVGEDVAVLRLDQPRPQARPARLDTGLWGGMEVSATGYAEGFDDGMSLWGRIGGVSGERVQLDAVTKAEVVRRGFSGAAVCTRPEEGRPARVVGLVVSWRGDMGELLPENNRLAFSYLIPVARIAELSPVIAELCGPYAWDHDFEERLTRWFADEDADEEPVKVTVVPPGTGKERSLRHLVHRADLVHRGGGSGRPDLADHALGHIAFPPGRYLAYWDWLLGTRPPPGRAPALVGGRPTVVVDGLDEEPEPAALIALLARLRSLGFRLLLVFRHEGGTGWTAARDELLAPALLDHADALLARLERAEFSRAVRHGVVDSASLGALTETAERRRSERRSIDAGGGSGVVGEAADPQQRLARLRKLVRTLRADLRRMGERAGGGPPTGERAGEGRPTGERADGAWPPGDGAGGGPPAGDGAGGGWPAGDGAGGGWPAGDRPGGGWPAGDRPSGGRMSGDRPSEGRGPGDWPARDRPSGDRSPGDRPSGGRVPGDRPAEGRPPGDWPTGDRSPGERPSGGRVPGDRPAEGRSPGGWPTGDRLPGDRPSEGRTPGGWPPGDREPGDWPAGDRPSEGRAPGDRPTGGTA
ncbi:V8-like Glu-specific endopeptidase [Streptomyces sp. cf124]|nr:V8-like Glu-specific endopeptidase [Streptomyces sp. cf124]